MPVGSGVVVVGSPTPHRGKGGDDEDHARTEQPGRHSQRRRADDLVVATATTGGEIARVRLVKAIALVAEIVAHCEA